MSLFTHWNRTRACHLALLSLCMLLLAPAARATAAHETWTANRTLEAHSGGLLYSLPYINHSSSAVRSANSVNS